VIYILPFDVSSPLVLQLFSHLSNDYLLKVALQDPSGLPLDLLLSLYHTASQFEIITLLSAYTAHLVPRINKNTLIPVLQSLLLSPSPLVSPHLSMHSTHWSQYDFILLLQSVSVLLSGLKGIFNSKSQDPRQMIILHEIIDRLFQLPLDLQVPRE
jgi:hypothetical protein